MINISLSVNLQKITYILIFFRIVRNKAAERAKVSYNMNTSGGNNQQQQQQGPGSPDGSQSGGLHVSASQTNSLVNNVMSPASGGQLSGPMGVPLGSGGAHQGHVESSLLHRPSYSINGILGIPQPDANANSIAGIKRKREDGGNHDILML